MWIKKLLWARNESEFISKENKWQKRFPKSDFSINPTRMEKITDKPNHITPSVPYKVSKETNTLDDPVDRAFKLDSMRRKIQTRGMVPRQKYVLPQTSAHEIGWHTGPAETTKQKHSQWNKKRTETHITQFADEYVRMKAINPFKVRNRDE
ncbi:unnamed protein product [Moneuplotes crassus]|uniref:Uncharacterized protein n=2 Tax=Euplotes crassus TaxID=5936 RepID=A0AAD1Y131_EUPCR|nr:unnamed protein product [Moneuplotes crassus]